jgi:hypothetical protein
MFFQVEEKVADTKTTPVQQGCHLRNMGKVK